MAEVGILAPDARVELIEGEIIDMAPIGTRHGSVVDRLNQAMVLAAQQRAIVRVQGAVRLSNWTEPEPDIAVLKPRQDFYREAHPSPADLLLVIEVAESSLAYDRRIKVPLYARHGVPEMWLIDLPNQQIHFHRDPAGDQYREVSSSSTPGLMSIAALPGFSIDLSQVL